MAEGEVYVVRPIGYVVSPYATMEEAPRQGFLGWQVAKVVIYEKYRKGLEGLEKGMLLDIIYWMDRARRDVLYSEGKGKGIFLTRGPHRPNPIGVSTVRVIEVGDGEVSVEGLDAIDGTPVVDIKGSLKGGEDGECRGGKDTEGDSRSPGDKGRQSLQDPLL